VEWLASIIGKIGKSNDPDDTIWGIQGRWHLMFGEIVKNSHDLWI
jgi:hypothetical protein